MGLPYSKFFWADYMRATRMLSCTAKGAWMDILCILADADDCGTLTNSATAWARYVGLTRDEFLGVVQELEAGGVGNIKIDGEQITITSNRLKRDYREYRAQSCQASEAGKKSGEARRKQKTNDRSTTVQRETNDRSTTAEDPLERNANEKPTIPEARSQKLELSKESVPRTHDEAGIPTLQEVLAYADRIGATQTTAKNFFDWYEGKNLWLNKHQKLINWRHELAVWRERDKTGFGKNGNNRSSNNAVDRNQGTANAGLAHLYEDVGRVDGVQNPE